MTSKLLWDLIEPITTVFEVMVAYLFFKDFLGIRENVRRWIYLFWFTLFCVSLCVINKLTISPALTVSFSLVSLILLSLLFDSGTRTKVFAAILFIAFMIASEVLAFFFIQQVAHVRPEQVTEQGTYRLLGILISKLILLVITRIVCMRRLERGVRLPMWQWALLLTPPLVSIFIMYTIYAYSSISEKNGLTVLSFISSVSILYINIIIYYLFTSVLLNLSMQTRFRLLEQQMSSQLTHYRELEASQKEMRRFRHDIKNHLLCVENLLHSGQSEAAEDYVSSVTGLVGSTTNIISTGNVVLDSLLSAKLTTISENNIRCENIIEVPAGLNIAPIDACIVFGNSFDNAIEACSRIKNGEKNIRFVIAYKNKSLIYNIVNTTDGTVRTGDGGYLSTKRNFSEIGLGLSNIEQVVKKYDGIMQTKTENNKFDLSVVLYRI